MPPVTASGHRHPNQLGLEHPDVGLFKTNVQRFKGGGERLMLVPDGDKGLFQFVLQLQFKLRRPSSSHETRQGKGFWIDRPKIPALRHILVFVRLSKE